MSDCHTEKKSADGEELKATIPSDVHLDPPLYPLFPVPDNGVSISLDIGNPRLMLDIR